MIKVFFIRDSEVRFVDVSLETIERLRKFAWQRKLSVHDVVGSVYDNSSGKVSEKLIVEYLNDQEASES